jgi:hypothetical protein
LFEQLDEDSDGVVGFDDFRDLVRQPRMKVFMSALGLEVNDAEEVFKMLDMQGERELNINTLMDGFTRLKGAAKSIDIVQTMEMIRRVEENTRQIKACMGIPDRLVSVVFSSQRPKLA